MAFVKLSETSKSKEKVVEAQLVFLEESLSLAALGHGTIVPVLEAKFSEADGKQTVSFIALQEGWSLNDRYYTKKAVERFAELVKKPGSKKMYSDHPTDKKSMMTPRSTKDWAATVTDASTSQATIQESKSITVATVDAEFTDNPATSWLYKESKRRPEEVGASVNVLAYVKKGEAPDGRKGDIVEDMSRAYSLDIVTLPAAGGHALATKESFEQFDIEEAMHNFDDEMKKQFSCLYAMQSALMSCFRGIMNDKDLTPDEQKEQCKKALKDFSKEMMSMDLVSLFKSMYHGYESVAFEKLAEHYKSPLLQEARVETDMELKDLTLQDLKTARQDLIESILKESEIDKIKSDSADLKTKLEESQKKIQEMENQEKLRQRKDEHGKLVDKILSESTLEAKDVSPIFKNDLLNLTETEKAEEAVRERVREREALVASYKQPGKIREGLNLSPSTNGTSKIDDEAALRLIRR